MPHPDLRRSLVDLLTGIEDLLIESGLQRPQFFLLQAIVQETDQGVGLSEHELCARLGNPFGTIHPWRSDLPLLVERGYLADTAERFTAAPRDGR